MFVVAEGFSWFSLQSWWIISQIALGLGVVIFVHELGHFLAAKSCGVKCEKFYVGFDVPFGRFINWLMGKEGEFKIAGIGIPKTIGPPIRWGETEYGIGIVPLGGYVKMLGQDDNPANQEKEAQRTRVKKDATSSDGDSKAAGSGRDEPAHEDHHKSVDDTNLEPQPLAENVDYDLDPRSYTAKAVWQRMIIISAGVVMNVIFAVVFATIAYRIGAPFTPAVVGSTIPGGPAWKIDLPRGAKVLQVGDHGEPREHLRFSKDMSQQIMFHGANGDLSLLIQERGSDSPYRMKVQPIKKEMGMALGKLAFIGVLPAAEPVLADENPILQGTPAARASKELKPNDRIVAGIVDGKETIIKDYWDLATFMAQNTDNTLTLRIERQVDSTDGKKTHTFETEIAPRPLRRLGLVMMMGPVTAIQANSPAEQAKPLGDTDAEPGFRVGDVLKALNGQPLDDPMTAPEIIRRRAGESVTITVGRAGDDGKQREVELQVTPRPVNEYQSNATDDPVLVDALGITYAVHPIVVRVDPKSDASDVLKPGDKVTKIQPVAAGETEEERTKNRKVLDKLHITDKEVELAEGKLAWTGVFMLVQSLPPEGRIKLTYMRGAKEDTIVLEPFDSEEFHFAPRGMALKRLEGTHQVGSWSEAIQLAFRQTGEDLTLVVAFLQKLFTRDLPPTSLGGPPSIAVAAYAEASKGPGALLLFLTLLSANLAVVNFLPIPMLDGGHMLFLTYEAIFRRPVPEAWQLHLSLLGLCFLLGLMVFVFGLDIFRFGGFAN